ncbi:MAG: argininosuccinate lyase, partial [Candidatus Omnitrophota bacterium]|nr:argininosuccinate lyase [Candidatus Omnitrophota bacterium]
MAKKLWGGRFKKKTDPLVEKFTRSIHYDWELAEYDVLGSIVHAEILKKCGYLSLPEASKLQAALMQVGADISTKKFKVDKECEDIHTQIQNILYEKTGDLALKLHTARSRNDQVVFGAKLYCATHIKKLCGKFIDRLIVSIEKLVRKNKTIIIPGFTHLQHAQPVYLKDYLKMYTEMLARDKHRLGYISDNMKITLGAGALAGAPINAAKYEKAVKEYSREVREYIKKFGSKINIQPTANSLDTVSDRDFVIEVISALSIVATHLSRLAEDLIIWSTKEFDFIEVDEAFCTGSSLMPQKKNPDALELVRGYAGRVYGNLVSVLTMMKGLPMTYNRDMQLDKEPLFDSFKIISLELSVLSGLIGSLKFNKKKIEEQLKD